MRKAAIGIAAAVTLAAVVPASAQGLWIGAPGFGVGIGVGPTYAYDDGGYAPSWGAGYRYGPSYGYQTYAYEPAYEYDSYAYVPDDGYVAYSYGPPLRTYAYESDSYQSAPRARYLRNYAYSPGIRTTRSYSYSDSRGVIKGQRGHRVVHNTGLHDRDVMHTRSAIGTERESATSRRVSAEAASKALAREQDSRQSKRLETGKAGASRVRNQTHP